MEFNFKRRLAIVMTMIMLLSFAGPAWARGGPEDDPCEKQIVIINGELDDTPVPPQLTRDPDTGVWTLSVTLDMGDPENNALQLVSESSEDKQSSDIIIQGSVTGKITILTNNTGSASTEVEGGINASSILLKTEYLADRGGSISLVARKNVDGKIDAVSGNNGTIRVDVADKIKGTVTLDSFLDRSGDNGGETDLTAGGVEGNVILTAREQGSVTMKVTKDGVTGDVAALADGKNSVLDMKVIDGTITGDVKVAAANNGISGIEAGGVNGNVNLGAANQGTVTFIVTEGGVETDHVAPSDMPIEANAAVNVSNRNGTALVDITGGVSSNESGIVAYTYDVPGYNNLDSKTELKITGDNHIGKPSGTTGSVEDGQRRSSAYGVTAMTNGVGAQTTLTLDGNTDVNAVYSAGGLLLAANNGAQANAEITGGFTVTQTGKQGATTYGIQLSASDLGKIDLTQADGDIVVNAALERAETSSVAGVMLRNDSSDIHATLAGSVTVTGEKGIGVGIAAVADTTTVIREEDIGTVLLAPATVDNDYLKDLQISGKSYALFKNNNDEYYVYSYDEGEFRSITGISEEPMECNSSLTLVGNVKSEFIGALLDVDENSKADMLIDGTVSGGEAGIVLMDETRLSENVTMTVWKVEPVDDAVVYTLNTNTGDRLHGADGLIPIVPDGPSGPAEGEPTTKLEKAGQKVDEQVQYIIRISDDSDTSMGTVTLDGTEKVSVGGHDYDISFEKKQVLVKLAAPEGFVIEGAYWDAQQQCPLTPSGDGSYYMVVPKGGGVVISMVLKEIDPDPDPDPDPKPGSDPDPDSDPDSKPAPGPDPKPGSDPDPKPGSDPDPKSGSDPAPDPDPKPDPVPDPESTKPDSEPPKQDPEPGPGSDTEPVNQSQLYEYVSLRINPDGGVVEGRKDSSPYGLSVRVGAPYTLKNFSKAKEGYVLLGWYVSDVGRNEDGWVEPDPEKDADKFLQPGETITVDKAMVLTAIWKEKK